MLHKVPLIFGNSQTSIKRLRLASLIQDVAVAPSGCQQVLVQGPRDI